MDAEEAGQGISCLVMSMSLARPFIGARFILHILHVRPVRPTCRLGFKTGSRISWRLNRRRVLRSTRLAHSLLSLSISSRAFLICEHQDKSNIHRQAVPRDGGGRRGETFSSPMQPMGNQHKRCRGQADAHHSVRFWAGKPQTSDGHSLSWCRAPGCILPHSALLRTSPRRPTHGLRHSKGWTWQ